ncbi:TetR family transcriptional regulator [Streptosporangium sp. NBC_01755]|uniref:TetR/AcrR family transcriptional regulator n=1 Tax=unclassified Streptosporangium TaxID=2632669 RepID=UPI002DDABE3B|nr:MULTISPECIES: TetR/AcrR family transcriptional regulator [unclassified Streptosporangium]WSA29334.1 TetR family transcriptional regulator [Streptosporangium sp. NBC_01810]WSC99223.1 TetR family transcriptional regulator [Streptosporangium sp. NBC_01755]
MRTALRSLASSDYERVKVSDVARDSGVALGTLYRYFTSKEHLFAAAFREWQEGLKRKLDKSAPAGETERERIGDVLHRTVRAFQMQPQFYRVLIVLETASDPYVADIYHSLDGIFVDIVRSGFASEEALDEDHQAIFSVLTAVLNGELRAWIMGRRTIDNVYKAIDDAIRLIYEFPAGR